MSSDRAERYEQQPIFVKDVKLASCLAACGAHPVAGLPMEKIVNFDRTENFIFYFENTGDTRDMVAAWHNKEDIFDSKQPNHPLNDPMHPFWFARASQRNRERYIAGMKECRELHFVKKNGKTYVLTRNQK